MQEIADGLTAIGWSGAGGGGDASLSYGSTAPLAPTNGTLWYDTTEEILKLFRVDTWVDINVTQSVINNINAQVTLAQSYAQDAQEALAGFTSIVATATTLSPESSATATFNASTGVLTLGIPQGIQGVAGADGAVMSVAGRTGDVTLTESDITDLDKYSQSEVDTLLLAKASTSSPTITGLKEVSVAMGANNIDLSLGNLFTKTITGATTLTVSNVPASGTVGYFILELTNGGAGAVTYPTGTKWSKGTAPTLTASGIDLLRFVTRDGGTRWEASRIQEDSK